MTLTAKELELRRRSIGASEAAAVLGENPWQTPMDVWASKKLDVDVSPLQLNVATSTGHYLEEGVAREYADAKGVQLRKGGRRVHRTRKYLTATPDYYLREKKRSVGLAEIKTVGPATQYHWDPDRTDAAGVPPYYQIQVQQQLAITGLPFCDVAAKFLVSRKLCVFRIEFNEEQWAAIEAALSAWWFKHIEMGEPPPLDGGDGTMRVLRARYPQVLKPLADAPDEARKLMHQYDMIGEEMKAAQYQRERIKAELCEMIGEAEGMRGPWGWATWKEQRGRIDWKGLAECLMGDMADDNRESLKESYRSSSQRVYRQTLKERDA